MKGHFSFIRIVEVLIGDVVGHHSALDHRMSLVDEIEFYRHQRIHVGRLGENTAWVYWDVTFTDITGREQNTRLRGLYLGQLAVVRKIREVKGPVHRVVLIATDVILTFLQTDTRHVRLVSDISVWRLSTSHSPARCS